MKLLAYCIVSHNRPQTLEIHLSSVSSVIYSLGSDQVSIYIFDNSTGDNSGQVRALASKYSTNLLQTEGASVSINFGKILEIPHHRYCIMTHDDDSCYISDLTSLLHVLGSSSFGSIFAARSLYINDFALDSSLNSEIPLIPLHLSIYPWRIPAFPAWIYPMNESFQHCFSKYFLSFPAGKYSDVVFLDRFLTTSLVESGSSPVLAPGITYLYRQHSDQDTSSFRLRSYMMMLHSINGLRRHHPLSYVLDLGKKIFYTCLYKSLCRSLLRSTIKHKSC